MVKSKAAGTNLHDPSHPRASHREWRSFMSPKVADMYNNTMSRESLRNPDPEDEGMDKGMDMRKLLKDIERLGSSTLTWNERKKLENKYIANLGGKPTKSHRMPLSVAKPMMKNIKRREEKKMEEEKLLGIFTKRKSSSKVVKRQPGDMVLKATEGYFSRGVLNVKHLLGRGQEERDDGPSKKIGKQKKGKRKSNKGKGRKGR